MPTAVNGCGTAYYGVRNRRSDESFITTEWLTLFFVPIIPLKSSRVLRVPEEDVNMVVFDSEGYSVVEDVPLCWSQVLCVYSFMIFLLVWCILIGWLFLIKLDLLSNSKGALLFFPFFFLLALPGFGLLLHRKYSLRMKK